MSTRGCTALLVHCRLARVVIAPILRQAAILSFMVATTCTAAGLPAPAPPLPLLPPWKPTYNMARSTIIEPCSSTKKPFNASLCASFGICDIDWSNQKPLWSQAKPMNCSEVLVDQARLVKAVNNDTRVFVYRNLVKALPWQTEVREKLENPLWWGFFLHKKNTTGTDATGVLYHDFEQTPKGDCGLGVQCGEYLWE